MEKMEIVQAREPFVSGERVVRRGETFRAGHPVVKAHPTMFEPFVVENELLEDASAKKRAAKTA